MLADTYFALGRILFFLGRYLDAASCFAAATDIQKESTTTSEDKKQERLLSCRANRALALAEAGFTYADIAHAIPEIEKYLRFDPDTEAQKLKGESLADRDLHLLSLAALNHAAGYYLPARRYWEKVYEDQVSGSDQAAHTDEMSHRQKRWRAGISLASIDIRQRMFPEAESILKNIHRDPDLRAAIDDSDLAGRANLSIAQADLAIARKDWEQAECHLQDAVKVWPHNVEATYHLGQVLASQEKYDEAESCLQRVVALSPWYAKAQLALGSVQLKRQESKTGAQPAGLKSLAAREWATIAICVLAAGAIFVTGMIWASGNNTVTAVTSGVNVSGSSPTPVATCAPGAQGCITGTQTTTTKTTADKPHDVPSGLLAAAGALAAVAAALLLSPRFSKMHIGPVDVEQPGLTSPRTIPSK